MFTAFTKITFKENVKFSWCYLDQDDKGNLKECLDKNHTVVRQERELTSVTGNNITHPL